MRQGEEQLWTGHIVIFQGEAAVGLVQGVKRMRLGQAMGVHLAGRTIHQREALHALEPSSIRRLPNIWFRIVHCGLQLSRMSRLPSVAADALRNDIPAPFDIAVETPEGYLEKLHLHVMVLALAQRSSAGSSPPDSKSTQALDQELQRAANGVPSHWWLPPNLAESSKSPRKLLRDMRRLVVQMLHYDLRTQLNVPCVLAEGGETGRQQSEMARIACVNSSREVLSSFILLRDFNRTASSYRFVNLLGLMAAITLVLAHLGGSRRQPHPQDQNELSVQVDSLLSHQAPNDRAMMKQALETMRCVSSSSGDSLCSQSADVLHRLLEVEATDNLYIPHPDSADVSVHGQSDNGHPTTGASASAPEEGERIFIPYFGIMRIARPYDNDAAAAACESIATTAFDGGAGTNPGYPPAHDAVDLVDPP